MLSSIIIKKRELKNNDYSSTYESMSMSKLSQIPFNCSYNFSSIGTPFASASAILFTSKSPGIATVSPVARTCDMKSSVCAWQFQEYIHRRLSHA